MSLKQDRLTFFGVLVAVVIAVLGYLQLGSMYPVQGRAQEPGVARGAEAEKGEAERREEQEREAEKKQEPTDWTPAARQEENAP
ncbi:MAG: hypothetical protein ACE37H_14630 [Phycisphaeraceae bacterium]